jgi:hypothetical protein
MLDVPGFVLASVRDLCPEDACILRLDKCRFKIQPRSAAILSSLPRQSLELVLDEPLVTSFQQAIASDNQAFLLRHAENMRQQVAHHLKDRNTEPEVTIYLD